MKRLKALQEQSQRAVRELAGRMEDEKAALRGMAAEVKSHLKALPEVATAAISSVQVRASAG